jgi:hypothetical protein
VRTISTSPCQHGLMAAPGPPGLAQDVAELSAANWRNPDTPQLERLARVLHTLSPMDAPQLEELHVRTTAWPDDIPDDQERVFIGLQRLANMKINFIGPTANRTPTPVQLQPNDPNDPTTTIHVFNLTGKRCHGPGRPHVFRSDRCEEHRFRHVRKLCIGYDGRPEDPHEVANGWKEPRPGVHFSQHYGCALFIVGRVMPPGENQPRVRKAGKAGGRGAPPGQPSPSAHPGEAAALCPS